MDATLLALPLLALVDSTSVGTLFIPVWLMTARSVGARHHAVYIGVVAACYWVLGLALAFGLAAVWVELQGWVEQPPAQVLALLLGAGLLVFALLPHRWRPQPRPGRLGLRERVTAPGSSLRPLVSLALVAVALESLTMLPYLGAVALLVAADLPAVAVAGLLAGYCLVMVLPAVLLLAMRRLAARQVEPVLRRLERWTARSGGEATRWVAGLLGLLLVRGAAAGLGLLGEVTS